MIGRLSASPNGTSAARYQLVPGVVRFYDIDSLPRLVEDQGLTVVECNREPSRARVLARA